MRGPRDHDDHGLVRARIEEAEAEFRAQIDAQIDAVTGAGLTPSPLDWHCLADGGRDDIFDLTVAPAGEYGLAVRSWLGPGLQKLRQRGHPVVGHDFLDSFSLGSDGESARYAQPSRDLPAGLSEWAVRPALGDGGHGRPTRTAGACAGPTTRS